MRHLFVLAALLTSSTVCASESTCYGTTGHGRLDDGVQLPESGPNFSAYSSLGVAAGRNHVHSTVQRIVIDAYKALETAAPAKVFVYGETGWKDGGRFRPHKTHQNGLSVDFMVPVLRDGRSVPLPTSVLNKFGYAIDFDDTGVANGYTIDFDALAAHLRAIKAAADARGARISRVIFEVPLQRKLFASAGGVGLDRLLAFSTKPAWVRHDEHYHVDFDVRCAPLASAST